MRRPIRLYVYSASSDNVRLVTMTPNDEWGGNGCLGCDVGYGLLHRIPRTLAALHQQQQQLREQHHHDHDHQNHDGHAHSHAHDSHHEHEHTTQRVSSYLFCFLSAIFFCLRIRGPCILDACFFSAYIH